MVDALEAIGPIDGRYAHVTAPLRAYASEMALMRERVRVETEYLLHLATLSETDLEFSAEETASIRTWVSSFDQADARRIKSIEVDGTDDRPATNHDVKAVEYFLRDRVRSIDRPDVIPWIHFGLTSEDVDNLAYRLLIRGGVTEVLIPALRDVYKALEGHARQHRSVVMPGRTHGQPASPTTFGKEMAVFAKRLDDAIERTEAAVDSLAGKCTGATGTLAAHTTVMPEVDWVNVTTAFVESFDLTPIRLTTQLNPGDDVGAVFDALALCNGILIDLDRDMWRYISDGFLVPETESGAVGSSTMPHKVNPIDFENSEGNLAKARSDLRFLSDYLASSRLQRDLSDSTVKRTIGATLGHCLLGYRKAHAGLESVEPAAEEMAAEVTAHPAVLAEAVQTALRRIGDHDAYERVKAVTRGESVNEETFAPLIARIAETDPSLASRLQSLSPTEYTGLAEQLVDELDENRLDG